MTIETFVTKLRGNDGKTVVRETTTDFDFGSTIADAIKRYGEEAVFDCFHAGAKVRVQAKIRAMQALKGTDKMTDAAIASAIKSLKSLESERKVDPKARAEKTAAVLRGMGLADEAKAVEKKFGLVKKVDAAKKK